MRLYRENKLWQSRGEETRVRSLVTSPKRAGFSPRLHEACRLLAEASREKKERGDTRIPIHIGPIVDRYVDRPLPGGTAKIDCRRSISAINGRFPPSAVD
ncbi:hypothetical protein GW17_00060695 [Ensete ventricosum]|nr:hypothetical protein GW17_00060695 [Ensete ventricosum]